MKELIDVLERDVPRLHAWKLIPGVLSRVGSQSAGGIHVMSLETSSKCNRDILVSTLGSKHSMFEKRRWIIKGIEGKTYGFLSQRKDGYYLLERRDDADRLVEVLKIHYKYHNFYKVLKDRPARKAEVSILGTANFTSKDTSSEGDGKAKCLYTAGRGRVKSSKNMQLINEDGKIVLQFVKWDGDKFHLDYKEPFDAFLAFGFALAQFDLGSMKCL